MKKEIAALIPLRGGSKSVPHKNIKYIAGKPLCMWVIEEAIRSRLIDKVYVTTDSKQIRDTINDRILSSSSKLEIIGRSAGTATDTAPTEKVMLEFAGEHSFEHICLLQATSPLISAGDIDGAINKYFRQKADSLLTVVRQKRFIWSEDKKGIAKPVNYNFLKRPRRQDFDGFLIENGAMYITSRERLLKTFCRISGKIALYEMPEYTYYELDEPDDFLIIERLLEARKEQPASMSLSNKLRKIKLLALDVDGVLTDGSMYYSPEGEALKRFSTYDGMGIELLRKNGIEAAIITKEKSAFSRKRAEKLMIKHVFTGVNEKKECLLKLAKELKLKTDEIAYMGDDVNDIEVLKTVGFSACPKNALEKVKAAVDHICSKQGGSGAVREVCDMILENGRK
ncbi:MAG: acylneuraminate cytidylyltransferase [Nitrospirota bacterium]|nr:acylneuraminate cytidylyltransferase [Nitrospirota bacterium]